MRPPKPPPHDARPLAPAPPGRPPMPPPTLPPTAPPPFPAEPPSLVAESSTRVRPPQPAANASERQKSALAVMLHDLYAFPGYFAGLRRVTGRPSDGAKCVS